MREFNLQDLAVERSSIHVFDRFTDRMRMGVFERRFALVVPSYEKGVKDHQTGKSR